MTADLLLPNKPCLVAAQRAALARLHDAVRRGGMAVLCGPAGSGKTLLLKRLACELRADGGHDRCGLVHLRDGIDGRWQVVLIDDAHAARDAAALQEALQEVLGESDRGGQATAVVLAGEGRLLTLLARQPDLEQRVLLRAVLPAWNATETQTLVATALPELLANDDGPLLAHRLHELAAGIPRQTVRLIETVRMVLSAEPAHRLTVDDLETFHRRLSLRAA